MLVIGANMANPQKEREKKSLNKPSNQICMVSSFNKSSLRKWIILIFSSCFYTTKQWQQQSRLCLGPLTASAWLFFFFSFLFLNDPLILCSWIPLMSPSTCSLSRASCTCLSSRAAGTSLVFAPMCPSIEWPGFLCPPPLRSARGSPRRSLAAGTSSQV